MKLNRGTLEGPIVPVLPALSAVDSFRMVAFGTELMVSVDGAAYQNVPLGGGGGAPGGVDTNVQFNDAGAFGGDNNFTYDGLEVGIAADFALTGQITTSWEYASIAPRAITWEKRPGDGALPGFSWQLIAQEGSDSTVGNAGNGAVMVAQAGTGGASSAGNGGFAGSLACRGGNGGQSTFAGGSGGLGGAGNFQGGGGGAGLGAGGNGGNGGQVQFEGGAGGFGNGGTPGTGGAAIHAGGPGGATNGAGGDAIVRGGQGNGAAGVDGDVLIGDTATGSILIANSVDNPITSIQGSGGVVFPQGAQIYMQERVGDPGGIANSGAIYTKDVAGVTQLFFQRSDGTVAQLS